jgi:hypothetical protein
MLKVVRAVDFVICVTSAESTHAVTSRMRVYLLGSNLFFDPPVPLIEFWFPTELCAWLLSAVGDWYCCWDAALESKHTFQLTWKGYYTHPIVSFYRTLMMIPKSSIGCRDWRWRRWVHIYYRSSQRAVMAELGNSRVGKYILSSISVVCKTWGYSYQKKIADKLHLRPRSSCSQE